MNYLVFLGAIGTTEIILIVLIVVLLFGGRKIPELMKGLGQGLHEFKKASKGETQSNNDNTSTEVKKWFLISSDKSIFRRKTLLSSEKGTFCLLSLAFIFFRYFL